MERGLTGHCRASGGGLCLAAGIAASWGQGSVAVMRASFGAKGGTGCPCFARVSRVRACGAAGGRIAAARFARLIARARRHTHLSRLLTPGAFSRPQPVAFCRKTRKAAPGAAFLYFHSTPYRQMSSSFGEQYRCFPGNFSIIRRRNGRRPAQAYALTPAANGRLSRLRPAASRNARHERTRLHTAARLPGIFRGRDDEPGARLPRGAETPAHRAGPSPGRPVPRAVIDGLLAGRNDRAERREPAALAFHRGGRPGDEAADTDRRRGGGARVLPPPGASGVAGRACPARHGRAQALPGNRALADRGLFPEIRPAGRRPLGQALLPDGIGRHRNGHADRRPAYGGAGRR